MVSFNWLQKGLDKAQSLMTIMFPLAGEVAKSRLLDAATLTSLQFRISGACSFFSPTCGRIDFGFLLNVQSRNLTLSQRLSLQIYCPSLIQWLAWPADFFSFNLKQSKGLLVNKILLIINLTERYTAWQKGCFLPFWTIKRIGLLFQTLCPTSSYLCLMLGKRIEEQRSYTSLQLLQTRDSHLAYSGRIRRQKVWPQEFRKIRNKNENEWNFSGMEETSRVNITLKVGS